MKCGTGLNPTTSYRTQCRGRGHLGVAPSWRTPSGAPAHPRPARSPAGHPRSLKPTKRENRLFPSGGASLSMQTACYTLMKPDSYPTFNSGYEICRLKSSDFRFCHKTSNRLAIGPRIFDPCLPWHLSNLPTSADMRQKICQYTMPDPLRYLTLYAIIPGRQRCSVLGAQNETLTLAPPQSVFGSVSTSPASARL